MIKSGMLYFRLLSGGNFLCSDKAGLWLISI